MGRPATRRRVAACALAATVIRAGAQALGGVGSGGALPMLRAQGDRWADSAGETLLLRGCNLGNWLLQEMWMHAMGREGISDHFSLEQALERRFGAENKDELLRTYRSNFITARDFATIKSFGMNVVRLPIWCELLEDDARPRQIRPNAWTEIDRAIAQAEAEGLYTILDLHGAPGGQNPWDHSGGRRYDQLWGNDEYKQRTAWLWQQIAARYRNHTSVAAYDLLNEPYTAPKEELRDLVFDCYRTIRAEDPDHIVIFPYADAFDYYEDLRGPSMHNVALTPHFYPGFFGWGEPTPQVHGEWLSKGVKAWHDRMKAVGVPVLVGEMNVVLKSAGGAEMMRRAFDTYRGFGWAVTMWSYKVFTREGGLGENGHWGMVTNPKVEGQSAAGGDTGYGAAIDMNASSFEEIKRYFESLSEMDDVIYDDLRHWLTSPEPPPPLPEASG